MYMAPEVLMHQPYNHLADVWSLGTLLYFLLCGEYPFPANCIQELKQNVMKGHYCIPADVHLSQECINFLNVCLQIDFRLRAGMKDLSEHVFMSSGRRMTIVQRIGSQKMNAYSPKTPLQHECNKIIEAVN